MIIWTHLLAFKILHVTDSTFHPGTPLAAGSLAAWHSEVSPACPAHTASLMMALNLAPEGTAPAQRALLSDQHSDSLDHCAFHLSWPFSGSRHGFCHTGDLSRACWSQRWDPAWHNCLPRGSKAALQGSFTHWKSSCVSISNPEIRRRN